MGAIVRSLDGEMKMISDLVKKFMSSKPVLEDKFRQAHPEDYKAIVKSVIEVISSDDCCQPDPGRIHLIDDGDHQGTLIFVIGATGYQPSDYWYVKVGYGSCSACDTLERIRDYSDVAPTEEQVKQYMMLALHVVQGLKKMGEDIARS